MKKKNPENHFFRSEKAIGPARAGKKKIEKFWPDELPARQPDRHRARIAGDRAPGYCTVHNIVYIWKHNINVVLAPNIIYIEITI